MDTPPDGLKPPWEALHPALTSGRLNALGQIICVWHKRKLVRRLPPDDAWNLGCDLNRWVRHGIELASRGKCASWLTIIQPGLDFLFAVGGVPIRFYRDDAPGQPERTLRISRPELDARQLAFQFGDPVPPEDVIRLAIERADDGTVVRVTLVQLDQGGDCTYEWPIPLDGARVVGISGPGKEGVDLGEPDVGLPKEEDEEREKGA